MVAGTFFSFNLIALWIGQTAWAWERLSDLHLVEGEFLWELVIEFLPDVVIALIEITA